MEANAGAKKSFLLCFTMDFFLLICRSVFIGIRSLRLPRFTIIFLSS